MSVSVAQISALIDFLSDHPQLASGLWTRGKEGRSLCKKLWHECATLLNSVGPDCVQKSPDLWRMYFNEYKCKTVKKIKAAKREFMTTGGGSTKHLLSPLQHKLYDIIKRNISEPLTIDLKPESSQSPPRQRRRRNSQIIVPDQEPVHESIHDLNTPRIPTDAPEDNAEAIWGHHEAMRDHDEAMREHDEIIRERIEVMREQVEATREQSAATNRLAAAIEAMTERLRDPIVVVQTLPQNEGFRQCHIRDGLAVSRLFKWLHDQVDSGKNVTEVQAADKLLEFRKDEADFMGPSFATIPGAGANGAIIHYSPSRNGVQKLIEKTDMFLLDSGGQYKDGTTDITRTRHMSRDPTPEEKSAFTRVLKGQIMVGSALFPQGVKGNVLDSFARHSLWEVGLDYAHGTGHGVGHFLNVHEGPSGVSWRPYPHDPGLKPGQILSNEPGYYKVGAFGIRHEDLVEIIKVTNDTKHPRARTLQGDYDGRGVMGFNTLTLVPHQKECIDVKLLTDFELSYINDYHKRVFDTLGPILKQRGLEEDFNWLAKECSAMSRN